MRNLWGEWAEVKENEEGQEERWCIDGFLGKPCRAGQGVVDYILY